jgi:polysaccharide pyruvyl transferase WcaK-like protein
MGVSGTRAPLIYLYVPISAAREFRPLVRSRLAGARAALKRARDRLAWRVRRSHSFDYHAWRTTEYTNRGDIAIRQAVRQILERKLGYAAQFVELDWGHLDGEAVERINAGADLFVICGGGYVSADAATGKLSRIMDDVTALAKIRCPIAAFGIGYNCIFEVLRHEMFDDFPPDAVGKLKALAASCRLIACRDDKLSEVLAAFTHSPVPVIGDPALFLEADGNHPDVSRSGKDEIQVGLNFALHGPISAGIFRGHFEDYATFLNRLQRTRPMTFWYFTHCDTERIAVALLRERGIHVRRVDVTPRRMIAAYGQMDFVICQMLHASILATNSGVPSMNIAYDVKNVSFYKLMGLPELCVPHDEATPQGLLDLFSSMVGRREEIGARIERRKAALQDATNAFAASVAAAGCEAKKTVRL